MLPHARTHRSFVPLTICLVVLLLSVALLAGCSSAEKAQPRPIIAADVHDPAVWGKRFPEVYARWLATRDPRPAGMSPYKRGFDGGVMYDKLSEFPFMPLLFKGWGFGIEYNEPRGHYYMLIDQQEISPERVKAGGACLACKSPYAEDLYEADKQKLFGAKYSEAVAMLPAQHRQLGVSCIDCHDTATLELATRRWTIESALEEIGVKEADLSRNDTRLVVCGQCHCTYSVMKDGDKVTDVDFPWEGSTWGAITIENIIDALESQQPRLEWTQAVTGFKLGFIRHPEFEFYTAGSTHFEAGVTCNDCHMPVTDLSADAVADHDIMSPLKLDMIACKGCHTASAEEMRAKVIAAQNRTLGQLIDVGYRVATVAKLVEIANASLETTAADENYAGARAHYVQAFYRLVFIGAENSIGFHNPEEAQRILGDAKAEAVAADEQLRKLLASKGVPVPKEVPLALRAYLDDRGVRKLDFVPKAYIPDPTGSAQKHWPQSRAALLR